MRVDNVRVKFDIPVHFGQSDKDNQIKMDIFIQKKKRLKQK